MVEYRSPKPLVQVRILVPLLNKAAQLRSLVIFLRDFW